MGVNFNKVTISRNLGRTSGAPLSFYIYICENIGVYNHKHSYT